MYLIHGIKFYCNHIDKFYQAICAYNIGYRFKNIPMTNIKLKTYKPKMFYINDKKQKYNLLYIFRRIVIFYIFYI